MGAKVASVGLFLYPSALPPHVVRGDRVAVRSNHLTLIIRVNVKTSLNHCSLSLALLGPGPHLSNLLG